MTGASAQTQVVNVYTWGGQIPKYLLKQFEQETGIRVNFSTYDSNEILYAKLKSSQIGIYDVIGPSSYFVSRMKQKKMLTQLDKSRLPNIKNLASYFTNAPYDPGNAFSIPLVWGTTGIFINANYIKEPISRWKQLWDKRYYHKLLLIDDLREVFSMSLLSLNFSANSNNLDNIHSAYQHLTRLLPNIKVFSSDNIQSILIDEDAHIGMVWNNDFRKAREENPHLRFIYPEEGFVVWVDCLSIPANAPHQNNAYRFLNFLLRAESSKAIALNEGYAITNQAGKRLLPPDITNDKAVYPDPETLKRGQFQTNIQERALQAYTQYWQLLKVSP